MNDQFRTVDERPLRALWDQSLSPVTFDFGTYLAVLDGHRQLNRPKAGIDLTIRTGTFRQLTARDLGTNLEEKRWRLKSVIVDLCELLPTIRALALTPDDNGPFDFPEDSNAPYYARLVVDLHRKGANPLVLKAPAYACQQIRFPRPYVTMTLRTSSYFPDRNPDLNTWHRFSLFLRAIGYTVVVIPDQEDFLNTRRYAHFDWTVYEAACLDLRLRMALYENAAMNIGSSNGPVGIMFYSQAPVLQFDQLRGGICTPEFWRTSNGFPVGEQFPWSRPNQRMTWTDSSYENMIREWTALKLS